MTVESQMDTLERKTVVTVHVTAEQETECRLALWLVEDSVPGVQAMPDGSVNMQYVHRHLLRGASGDGIFGRPLSIYPNGVTTRTQLSIPEVCDLAHCEIIALLLDAEDRHVLQARACK